MGSKFLSSKYIKKKKNLKRLNKLLFLKK